MQKLAKQQEYELAQLDKQMANEKALLSYQNSLKSSGSSGGGGGSTSSKGSSFSKSNTASTSKTTSKTTSTTPKTTMDSILALGYGPINATYLNQLVASGAVEEYQQNGVTMFRKATKNSGKTTGTKSLSSVLRLR